MNSLTATTINEAAFLAYRLCIDKGRTYRIERGSFVGVHRKQLDTLAISITCPWTRPLATVINNTVLSNDDDIEQYFLDYLVSPERRKNEQYTYGERIAPHLERIAQMLQETPNTNQATIEVGHPEDISLDDPPCLRVLSWKTTTGFLQLSSFWRSWDITSGLPTNLGGLQLLNEMMGEWAGLKVGPLIAYSDGAHVYEYSWSL